MLTLGHGRMDILTLPAHMAFILLHTPQKAVLGQVNSMMEQQVDNKASSMMVQYEKMKREIQQCNTWQIKGEV